MSNKGSLLVFLDNNSQTLFSYSSYHSRPLPSPRALALI